MQSITTIATILEIPFTHHLMKVAKATSSSPVTTHIIVNKMNPIDMHIELIKGFIVKIAYSAYTLLVGQSKSLCIGVTDQVK